VPPNGIYILVAFLTVLNLLVPRSLLIIMSVLFLFYCHLKYFYTRPGHVLTLHFAWMWTDRNDSAVIEVFDGASPTERRLASVSVRNGTRPQSVVTTRHTVYIRFKAEARTQMIASMKLTSGYSE
jgi:hypothetical protein